MKFALIAAAATGGFLLLLLIVLLVVKPSGTGTTDPTVVPTVSDASPTPIQYNVPGISDVESGHGLVTGIICSQGSNETAVPSTQIVAEEIPSRIKHTKFYPGYTQAQTTKYAIGLEPGTYELYTQDSTQQKSGIYSTYVTCGKEPTCVDHNSIEVEVEYVQVKSAANLRGVQSRDVSNPIGLPEIDQAVMSGGRKLSSTELDSLRNRVGENAMDGLIQQLFKHGERRTGNEVDTLSWGFKQKKG